MNIINIKNVVKTENLRKILIVIIQDNLKMK